jgi:excisionase family DNA binding protein
METQILLMKITEVARALGVSKSTVYTMIAKGEIPSIRIRGGLRVSSAGLTQWIEEKAEEGQSHD